MLPEETGINDESAVPLKFEIELDPQQIRKAVLTAVVDQWKKRAARYFALAETEKDPLGQKFYQSSAMAYANCVADVERLKGYLLTKGDSQ